MRCTGSCCRPELEDPVEEQMLSARTQRARKPYRCSNGCRAGIVVGQVYVREFWLVDGEPTDVQRHGDLDCSLYEDPAAQQAQRDEWVRADEAELA
jgi:hypothetical protein